MNEDEKTCEQLSAYMDGELDADASQGIERAIQSDPKLAAELARLRATRELVRRLDRVEAPAGLADSVLQQAERRCLVASAPVRGRLPAPRWLRFAAVAAALAIAVCAGMIIWQALPLPDDPPEMLAHRGEDGAAQPAEPSGGAAEDMSGGVERKRLGGLAGKKGGTDARPKSDESIFLGVGGSGKGSALDHGYRKKDGADIAGKLFGARAKLPPVDALSGVDDAGEPAAGFELAGGRKLTKGYEVVKGTMVSDMSLGRALDKAENVEINVDDLPAAQREVEKVLIDNRLQPLLAKDLDPAVQKRISGHSGGNGYYDDVRNGRIRQVQYVVLAAPKQISQLKNDLDGFRAKQRVAQVVTASRAEGKEMKLALKDMGHYSRAKREDEGLAERLGSEAPAMASGRAASPAAPVAPHKDKEASDKSALRGATHPSTMPLAQPTNIRTRAGARVREPATRPSMASQMAERLRYLDRPWSSSRPSAAPVRPLLITLNVRIVKSAATAPAAGRPPTTTSAPSGGKSDSPATQPKGMQQSRPAAAGTNE